MDIWRNYINSYEAHVSRNDMDAFTTFLRGCNSHYWRLAEILGALEQTLLSWHHFTHNYGNSRLPYFRLMEFYAVLKRLHLNKQPVKSLTSFEASFGINSDDRTLAESPPTPSSRRATAVTRC